MGAQSVSLQTETVQQTTPILDAPEDRRASPRRRGRERRKGGRINRQAPRRSILQAAGLSAISASSGVAASIFLAGELVLDATPWLPLGLALTVLGFAVLAYMIGCIEQRLIEIRLELMMVNGGARQADRRTDDRRASADG
ncbi:hypothetical protein BZG35_09020 [Brevundimonas sp. LM2]|nr:hypothetical protein BZG35_09020 [Brevundimonas sp. LM2]